MIRRKTDRPLAGAVLAALAIAAMISVTIGPPPTHKKVGDHQSIARH
ncbi:hypothetical protein [Bradyrhizobium ivorense]|nr:hypothetical protein [Bradyrhizobium ivorense]MCC8938787.1 hypothetical protein [Bradyrhizobium ivorense]